MGLPLKNMMMIGACVGAFAPPTPLCASTKFVTSAEIVQQRGCAMMSVAKGRRDALLAIGALTAFTPPVFAEFEAPQTALARALVGDTEKAAEEDKKRAKEKAKEKAAAADAKEARLAAAKAKREAERNAKAAK